MLFKDLIMTQERDCIVSVNEFGEGPSGIEPSFLATDEALAAFAQIFEMSPEEAQDFLDAGKVIESQKVGL